VIGAVIGAGENKARIRDRPRRSSPAVIFVILLFARVRPPRRLIKTRLRIARERCNEREPGAFRDGKKENIFFTLIERLVYEWAAGAYRALVEARELRFPFP
jgi:hypothetical protein